MTVTKTSSGRFRAIVKFGRQVVTSKTFDLKRDADAWHDAQKRALEFGTFVDPKVGRESLGSAMARWMEGRAGTIAGSTLRADRNRLKYLPSSLSKLPVSKVRTGDVQNQLDALIRRGLSPASVTRVRAMVSTFYSWARLHGMASVNPVSDSKVPSGEATKERAEVYPFNITQLREVVTELSANSERQASLALVLGLTGLRWGELCALRVRDVSSVPFPALNVTRSAPDGQLVRNRTKSGRGRSVPLAAELVPIVAEWAIGKAPDDLLFTSEEGNRLNNSNWRRIVGWPSSCRGRRIHDLRHTAATFWLQNGADVKTVQQWLGHESAQLTINLYTHWMGSAADAASIDRVNAALNRGYAGGTRALS
jgi:integrase